MSLKFTVGDFTGSALFAIRPSWTTFRHHISKSEPACCVFQ